MQTNSKPMAGMKVQTDGSSQPIKLVINGLTICAFKNRKRAIQDRKTGKMRTLTEPKVKKRMDELTLAIESALLSVFLTGGSGTLTDVCLQSWTASSLPLGDSRNWIAEIHVTCEEFTLKGMEGVTIEITPL